MDKSASEFIASKYAMKSLMDEFYRYRDILSDTNIYIIKVFKDLIEYQYALATKNGAIDVNGSEILYINAGCSIIYLTRETLTHIKGKRMEALFVMWWDKILQKEYGGRVFLVVNFKLFQAVMDCMNKHKIAPPNSSLEIPRVWKDNVIFLQQSFFDIQVVILRCNPIKETGW